MKDDDIIKAARDRMSEAIEADKENREDGHDDLEFIAGRQWPEEEREARETEGRPVITINRMPQFVRQVTGDLRRLNPGLVIKPGDNEATEDGAELMAGMVRAIEATSNAAGVYEDAAISAAQCGIGHWRILTEYAGEKSFDQVLRIAPIKNPFSVVWDPAARDPSRADAKYCFVTERMSKKDFQKEYPDASLVPVDMDMAGQVAFSWYDDGDIIVAEYFWIEETEKTIYLLQDGSVVDKKPPEGVVVLDKRETTEKQVMWAKVSGSDVLEGPREIPCKHIPIISVVGEEIHIGDEIVRTSVIRFAKDPQRLYNYFKSAHAEFVALQPKAPYIVTGKQIAGLETFWAQANQSNRPYLPYNPDEKAPGPPARQVPPTPSSGMMQEMLAASDDMQATTGIYDAALGQRSNEKSGVAIRQRQMESDISTSVYGDNLQRSIEHCGRILVEMIPKIYDTERVVRIVGVDDEEMAVRINSQRLDEFGNVIRINPLAIGKYDVRVSVGPNYSTRRQEVAEGMMQFIQAYPAAAAAAGDLIAKAMDWPDADKLAERLKKMLPPGVAEEEQPNPQQMQAMQQQQAMQEEAQQLARRKAMAELAKAEADAKKAMSEAKEAEADAFKAQAEAQMVAARMAAPAIPAQPGNMAVGQPF
jgi:hypothetical protein